MLFETELFSSLMHFDEILDTFSDCYSCHVMQGPTFSEIPRLICPEHYVSLCSLVASVQRCLGLWRLREVLIVP